MPTCPSGHQSQGADWCDECGLRISPPVAPSYGPGFPQGAGAPGAVGAAESCPQCGTPRETRAMFCEECAYRFPLPGGPGAFPASFPPTGPFPPPSFPPPAAFPPPGERTTSGPSRINRPAETLSPHAAVIPDSGDFLLPPPTGRTPTFEQSPRPPATAPVAAVRGGWTAVVAADREYFTAMMARSGPEAAGLYFPQYSPELRVPLTEERITIGRRRQTTGEAPVIDLSRPPEDPGVSHRHAVLVRRADGGWSVVDQDSTNGTSVNLGADTIEPFQPVDLADGDRVHVGAWTTITLRQE